MPIFLYLYYKKETNIFKTSLKTNIYIYVDADKVRRTESLTYEHNYGPTDGVREDTPASEMHLM